MKTEVETAWAAGLFEGEGCIAHYPKSSSRWIGVASTDEDVLRRFHEAVGVGRVTGPFEKPRRKPVWKWRSTCWPDTQQVLESFLPFLGERRSEKARALLADPARPQKRRLIGS